MRNKKLLVGVVAVTLVAVLGVGATLAYFTDKEEATNVITMGHVDIELTEPNFEGQASEENENEKIITNILPGQEIPKDPTITLNPSSEDAYIRVKLDCRFVDVEGEEEKLYSYTINKLIPELNENKDWFYSDGYYYYQKVLTQDDTTTENVNENIAVMFNKVVIPAEWGNEYADGTLKISIVAEAIQKDNFTPKKDANGNISDWSYEDAAGKEIEVTAETYEAIPLS